MSEAKEVVARRKPAQRKTAIEKRAEQVGAPVAYILKNAIEETATMAEAAVLLGVSVATLQRYRERYNVRVEYTK